MPSGEEIIVVQIKEHVRAKKIRKGKTAPFPWVLALQNNIWHAISDRAEEHIVGPVLPDFDYPNDALFVLFANQTRYIWSLDRESAVKEWVSWAVVEVDRISILRPELARYLSAQRLYELVHLCCPRRSLPLFLHTPPTAPTIDDIAHAKKITADASATRMLAELMSRIQTLIKQWVRLCPVDPGIDCGQWYMNQSLNVRNPRFFFLPPVLSVVLTDLFECQLLIAAQMGNIDPRAPPQFSLPPEFQVGIDVPEGAFFRLLAQTMPKTIPHAASPGAAPSWHRGTSRQLALDALEQGLKAAEEQSLHVDGKLAAALRSAMRGIPLNMQDLIPPVYHRLPLDLESTGILAAPAAPLATTPPLAPAPAAATTVARNDANSQLATTIPEPALLYSFDDSIDDMYLNDTAQEVEIDYSASLVEKRSLGPDAGQGGRYSDSDMTHQLAEMDRVLEEATRPFGDDGLAGPLSSTPAKVAQHAGRYDSDSGMGFI
jgi:hypothetical protein